MSFSEFLLWADYEKDCGDTGIKAAKKTTQVLKRQKTNKKDTSIKAVKKTNEKHTGV